MFTSIKKRDGRVELFEVEKITNAIWKAGAATGEFDYKIAQKLTLKVLNLAQQAIPREIPTVEEIQDVVEEVLLSSPYRKTAKAYIIYREQHAGIREITAKADVDLVDQYLEKIDWQVNENSNMSFSLQGLNNYVSSEISKIYWMIKIYPPEVRKAHSNGDFHIHDLNLLSVYCVGWDLFDLLVEGFKGAQGKIESKPAKHLRSALGQIVNFFYTLQGEAAGAQAFSNFDTLLAPFIRYDGLGYKEVKQALQEFVFNINVPTRVGFQCMSEDTEILGENGWKRYNQVKEGDAIATFNIEKGFIEYLPVRHVFAREYRGMMYNLKNRISDQLISPEHRVVRRRFGAEGYTLEKIEKVYDLKSPFMVPVGSEGKMQGNNWVDKDVIKLIAWVIAEGTIDRSGRGSGRISIYQSKGENRKNYDEILSLGSSLKLKYTERAQKGLGNCNVIRFDADSTRKILQYFKTNKNKFRGIKFIPDTIINADAETARLFLETYIKGEGHDGCKITNTSAVIKDGLMQVIVNAGYGATVLTRKPDNAVSKKDRYIIRIIRHKDTYINTVKKVNYSGVIWCPNTDNETVIARRNGKIFITGNTPFTNITLDLTVPEYYAGQGVIIGGEIQKETYREFQEEMELFNKAFLEVMAEGDAKGRVFTFPIPTYNITKDFDWGNPNLDVLWQVTAKYGVPYFSNFINSDMNPGDARSMCCRLRIDNRELKKRGGGLFGSSPLTGSIGVVTINMSRLGYLAKDEDEFISALERLMVLAKESLEVKRKVLEKFTEESLYPYTRYYLRGVKERFGEYWKNHFSTIGLVGMNEACLNMFGENIASDKSRGFTSRVLDFMRGELLKFQAETGNNYNLEATPAEGTSYRLAKKDKEKYPGIICANEEEWAKGAEPFYTNSTQLPVNYTEDVFEALDLQDAIQTRYTGGCLEAGNKVLTNKGLLKIEEIVKDFTALKPIKALSYNPEEGISEWDEITDVVTVDLKRQNKIRVKGERGLDIVTSDWHPFFILKKVKLNPVCPVCGCRVKNIKSFATHLRWSPECRMKYRAMPKYQVVERRSDELKVGDYILQNSCNLYPERETELNNDLMWLIGFFIGDGSVSEFVDNRGGNNLKKYKVRFFSEQQAALRKAAKILNKYFDCKVKVIQTDKRSEPLREVATSKKEVAEFFLKLGFAAGKKVYNIAIPKEVKDEISCDNVYSLLSGLGDSDGHIGRRDGDFEYSTISSKLAEDILEICTRAGIVVSKGKKIKNQLSITVNKLRIKRDLSNRKKRYLPVVRVKEVSKDEVQDNQFYDLTTQKNHNYLAGRDTFVFVHNTVFHVFAGERVEDPTTVKVLVRRICELYHLPYFTFTPTFSVCPVHGYIAGEHYTCPECGAETEVYSRVVGYLRPVTQWNKGKREEFKKRKTFVVEAVQKLKKRRKRKADIALKPPRIEAKAKREYAGKQLNLMDFGG